MKDPRRALLFLPLAGLFAAPLLAGLSMGDSIRADMIMSRVSGAVQGNIIVLRICGSRAGECPERYTEAVLDKIDLDLGRYVGLEKARGGGLPGLFAMDEAFAAAYPEIDFGSPLDYQEMLARYESAGADINKSRRLFEEPGSPPLSRLEIIRYLLWPGPAIVAAALAAASVLLALVWHKLEKIYRDRGQAAG